ncbi:hypothetical protein BDU57DRAFT_593668 [Ampelomyces quisqualis]|uniref:Uncharacterized protein n=1 Tax=Ampelomyces quisqualis TaxID=50730 RepID=A0A6A5QYP4_AMPQU|nr:hypothetical protein BDU57DRAFT_593668 [Ampelomyces quisqualis]
MLSITDRVDDADYVQEVLTLLRTVQGSGRSATFDTLVWKPIHSWATGTKCERLQVGELNGSAVYAYLRRPDQMPSFITDLVTFISEHDTQQDMTKNLARATQLAPFKYLRPLGLADLRKECPLKAFILACFVLRGHSNDCPLPLTLTMMTAFKAAILKINTGAGNDTAQEQPRTSMWPRGYCTRASASRQNASASPRPHPGPRKYGLGDMKTGLEMYTGLQDLPYLTRLRWLPIDQEGAKEKLHIGTRLDQPVFAYFNPWENPSQQLMIKQGDGREPQTTILSPGTTSITLFKPYSEIKIANGGVNPAKELREYLKGCFILRGHAKHSPISINLRSFVKTVSKITAPGFSISKADENAQDRGEVDPDTTEVMIPKAHTSPTVQTNGSSTKEHTHMDSSSQIPAPTILIERRQPPTEVIPSNAAGIPDFCPSQDFIAYIDDEVSTIAEEMQMSWLRSIESIIANMKKSETHDAHVKQWADTIARLKKCLASTTSHAHDETKAILQVCEKSVEQSISEKCALESINDRMEALTAARTRITELNIAAEAAKADFEAQIAEAETDKKNSQDVISLASKEIKTAKKRKADVEGEGGFLAGVAMGMALERARKQTRLI